MGYTKPSRSMLNVTMAASLRSMQVSLILTHLTLSFLSFPPTSSHILLALTVGMKGHKELWVSRQPIGLLSLLDRRVKVAGRQSKKAMST